MTTPVTRDSIQAKVGTALQFLQGLWEVQSPGEREDMVIDLILRMTQLIEPANTGRLNRMTALTSFQTDDPRAKIIDRILNIDSESTEVGLVAFILGDDDGFPAWEDVAAKIVELAMREALENGTGPAAPPAAPVSPAPVPPAPAPESPAATMARLRRATPEPTALAEPAVTAGRPSKAPRKDRVRNR